ncbi:MAG: hypothetical protein ACK5QH_08750 [Rubrivivax sp.]
MPAISKAWVAIADTAVDPDSPLDTALLTGMRDNLVHLREWLGAAYTAGAVTDHNHDGVNSALVQIGPNGIRNGSFESDADGWTITTYTGGSQAINTTQEMDGAKCLALTSTSTVNGGGVATSNEYRTVTGGEKVGFKLAYKASVANVSSRARVIWYSDALAQISTTDLYTTTNTPTANTVLATVATAPTNARFYRVELTGGIPGSGTATGTVFFDGVNAGDSAASGATCTYEGTLVETAGIQVVSNQVPGTADLGSNRVATGIRTAGTCGDRFLYLRGYNIRNI